MKHALSDSRILVTGADGFIGKNLRVRLNEIPNLQVLPFVRGDNLASLPALVEQADIVIHLAGENRPADTKAFAQVNTALTVALCQALRAKGTVTGCKTPLVFTSSTQAELFNPYGSSKLAAEAAIKSLANDTGNTCVVYRLPGVFGKWCKPNYNSVVATFCYNLARDLPIQIHDPRVILQLVYIDDVVTALLDAVTNTLANASDNFLMADVQPQYKISLGELAEHIKAFDACRRAGLQIERVGTGMLRALYATYVSYLPNDRFSYDVPQYADSRGVFVEMLKTPDCGQFSYFTAYPGVTRGEHYHHTKTEKFLVIKGQALFRFRHLLTDELVEFTTSAFKPQVVDTIPGWVHSITNAGKEEMLVLLWANESFDRARPDTVASEL